MTEEKVLEVPFNTEIASVVDFAVSDTLANSKWGEGLRENQISLMSFRQFWVNSLIGRDRVPGEAVGSRVRFEWTIIMVINDGDKEVFRIYHGKSYCYTIEAPTDHFWYCIEGHDLPGSAAGYKEERDSLGGKVYV